MGIKRLKHSLALTFVFTAIVPIVIVSALVLNHLSFDTIEDTKNKNLMLARAIFEQGSIGYTHSHPHAQLAYVESGVFEFTITDETTTLKKGDCAYVPPGAEHGAVCLESGVLLDIFSPLREDFLAENNES